MLKIYYFSDFVKLYNNKPSKVGKRKIKTKRKGKNANKLKSSSIRPTRQTSSASLESDSSSAVGLSYFYTISFR